MRRAAAIGFVIAAAMASALGGSIGCHEGNGLGAGDMTEVDLLPPPDLEPAPDLIPPPNCGKIVFCALGCLGGGGIGLPGTGGGGGDMSGANPIGCVLGCGTNAPPAEVTAALSLIACAAQNCLAADGGAGGGGQLGILQCLQMSCPSQLNACHGIGISADPVH
ncbi:MAG TPA: hypothetical protein VF334_15605 [Polyangia bacterium]